MIFLQIASFRSLSDYQQYAGIDFNTHVILPDAKTGVREPALWGECIQEDLLRLLENFASHGTPPRAPTIGQFWYNADTGILGIWNGTIWYPVYTPVPAPVWITPESISFTSGTYSLTVRATGAGGFTDRTFNILVNAIITTTTTMTTTASPTYSPIIRFVPSTLEMEDGAGATYMIEVIGMKPNGYFYFNFGDFYVFQQWGI